MELLGRVRRAVILCPHCGGKNPATNLGCTSCGSDIATALDEMLPTATDDWTRVVTGCTILGGHGLNLRRRGIATLRFSSIGVEIATGQSESLQIPTHTIVDNRRRSLLPLRRNGTLGPAHGTLTRVRHTPTPTRSDLTIGPGPARNGSQGTTSG